MWLSEVFSGGQINHSSAQAAGTVSAQSPAVTASACQQTQNLTPGQTLQGEVISRNGSQVQIQVAENLVLEAQIAGDMNLEVGRILTFEVRGNGQTLMLSPLFANTASRANALKALEMASLPVNQTTVSMTGLMMEAGLSIDRASLQQMFREVNAFPEAKVSNVVDLHRLGITVNEENLTQINSYRNLTHQLVEGMHTVLDALPGSMQAMVAEGNLEGAVRMLQSLLGMIRELEAAEPADHIVTDHLSQDAVRPEGQLQQAWTDIVEQFAGEMTPDSGTAMGFDTSERLLQLVGNGAEKEHIGAEEEHIGAAVQEAGEDIRPTLRDDSPAGQAKVLQQLLERGIQKGDRLLLENLVSGRGTQRLLAEGLSRLWTIEPGEVADAGRVEELYSRLDRQLKVLARSLEQNGQNESAVYKAVSNMNQNLDFLQQLNQTYTYIQLPLRLQQGDAHGDLYVYTNKRNLASGDGRISALLHLDMEHLGPVDVYVTMQAEHVNTRFYVRDDEMLDFLEAHMELLTERLQKRGYSCDFAMQVQGESSGTESGVKGLLAQEHAQPIARYAFDVRA